MEVFELYQKILQYVIKHSRYETLKVCNYLNIVYCQNCYRNSGQHFQFA